MDARNFQALARLLAVVASNRPASGDHEALRVIFRRGGYVRSADLAKRKERGSERYKKGYEVRFVLDTESELKDVRRLLKAAGYKPGKPFEKHAKIVQPVYGRVAVEAFRT